MPIVPSGPPVIGAVTRLTPALKNGLSIGGQGFQGVPDPAAQLLHPFRIRLPDVQDRLQGGLLGLQVRIDAALEGLPQLLEEAFDRGFSSGA